MADGYENRSDAAALAEELLAAIAQARSDAREDPFGSPVLRVALGLTRRMDRGEITLPAAQALLRHLGRAAIGERAKRTARYVGLTPDGDAALQAIADTLVAAAETTADPVAAFAASIARVHFAAVFTAHPTFGMSRRLAHALADLAIGGDGDAVLDDEILSFRPDGTITLQDEFEQARYSVRNARDAIDRLNAALLGAAKARWPERWRELAPRPIILASWVGCDTDGRTDIGWWDTLRYRLESKRGQFTRMLEKLPEVAATSEVRAIVGAALAAVERQLALAPPIGTQPALTALQAFALALVGEREAALPEATGLIAALDRAIVAAGDDEATAMTLCLVKAGCVAHGVSIALPHFRLNASQLHNALRAVVPLDGEPEQPAQRRAFLAAANALLGKVEPVPVDFGALAVERASAARMMMTIAQIVKHLDGSRPVRFLIAETETGYTLLSALWLAKRFGIAGKVEISPLFETSDALEQGPRIIDEALRSPHFRDYLKQHGRLCIQFGYSDSGRYIGQIAASFWVERLRLRIAELLARYQLADVELVIFDTHGESAGRGAHPRSLADRLAYLDPAWARAAFARAGVATVRETSFQGSDGYLLFGNAPLAAATVGRIAEAVFATQATAPDPIYDEPDFATEFFQTVRDEMTVLVDDPGYAALIGTFGPSLLDKTGSRPAARQSDAGGPARIRHPRELRAIPNNAILQQLGWLANSVHGIGQAAARAPDLFLALRERSERFERAIGLADSALGHSDLDVLRAYLDTLDPGNWFDRARRTVREGRRDELLAVAEALARLDLAPALRRLFWRLSSDALKLRTVTGAVPEMPARLVALHALRLAVLHRIWFLATHIPDFRPHAGLTREALFERILRLDIPGVLAALAEIFPLNPDPTQGLDFGEPRGPREAGTYGGLHREVFAPMRDCFALLREISGIIQHEIGAFG
jgi:phosphoenolpyruvate carboxylase